MEEDFNLFLSVPNKSNTQNEWGYKNLKSSPLN